MVANGKGLDWLDRRCFYVLGDVYGYERIKRSLWRDLDPLNYFAIPFWIWREVYRALRNKPSFKERYDEWELLNGSNDK
jgi:hypothetical protein